MRGRFVNQAINGETTSRVTDMGARYEAKEPGVIELADIDKRSPAAPPTGWTTRGSGCLSTCGPCSYHRPVRPAHFAGKASEYGELASSSSRRRGQISGQSIFSVSSLQKKASIKGLEPPKIP